MDAILLTGATGYLGSRVAATLDRQGLPFETLATRLAAVQPRSLNFTTVIHCAGARRDRPQEIHSTNVEGMTTLLDGLKNRARIVFVSTRLVYPRLGHRLVDENERVAPWEDYGHSKLAAETTLRQSSHDYVIVRSGGLFGHPSRAQTFPDIAFDRAMRGKPVTLAMPDRAEDYLDVDTLADLLVASASDGLHWGQTFNAAGPVRSLHSIMVALKRVVMARTGKQSVFEPAPIPVSETTLLDTRKLRSLFPSAAQPSDEKIFARKEI